MKTTLKWLGTGSGLNFELGNTSLLIQNGVARRLLIDCGYTVPKKLYDSGVLDHISDILITHLHADHIGGLETVGFYHYFALQRRGEQRPRLHLPSDDLAHDLWNHALKAGMGAITDPDGGRVEAYLDTYFDVRVSRTVAVEGLPSIDFEEAPHVPGEPNFALRFSNGVYYSGDSTAMPPHDPTTIFQDCQFGPANPSEIHMSYEKLRDELPDEVRAKTYLVHLSSGMGPDDPKADGFAGCVMPGDVFEI